MRPKTPDDKQSIGNSEVVNMLEHTLARAKLGRTCFAVVVMADNPYHVLSEHAGDLLMAMAANWGLDQAKHRLMVTMMERHALPVKIEGTQDTNHFFYNMSKGPACYDFIPWLIIAEMTRRKSGAPAPLKVSFAMGMDNDQEKALHNQYRKVMYDGVIKPALALIDAVEVEPVEGAKAAVLERYTIGPIQQFAKEGASVPLLTPPWDLIAEGTGQTLRKDMEDFLGDGPPPITITLRECSYWEHRNSNLTEWFKVAEYLINQGERVIFLRDTAKADEDIAGFETCKAAAIDLHMRMALYEMAKCNMFVSNGPVMLGVFGTKPWLMFVELDQLNQYYCETPQFYKEWQGLDAAINEQFYWSKPTQRIIYKRDDAENIIAAWEELKPLLDETPKYDSHSPEHVSRLKQIRKEMKQTTADAKLIMKVLDKTANEKELTKLIDIMEEAAE